MFWNDKRKIRILFWFTVLWMISSFLGIAYYLWTDFFIMEAQADVFDNIMWAKASMESGSLVNADFTYPYVIPLGGHLLLIPFISMFGMSILTIRCGMTIFTIIFILALFFFLKIFFPSIRERFFVIGTILWLLLGTTKLREIFFAHVIHYSLAILLFLIGFILLEKLYTTKNGKYTMCCLLFGIHFFIIGVEGVTVILFAACPIILIMFWHNMNSEKKWSEMKRDQWYPLIFATIGVLVGYFLHRFLCSACVTNYEDKHMNYKLYTDIGNNIAEILKKWFAIFLKVFSYNEISWEIISKNGIIYTIKIFFALFLSFFSFLSVFLYKKTKERKEKMLIVSHWVISFLTVYFCFFGTIAEIEGGEWRLIPMWFSNILITLVLLKRMLLSDNKIHVRRWAAVGVLFLWLNALLSVGLLVGKDVSTQIWFGEGTLIDTLERENVKKGYCTDYWMCYSVTVLTGEGIEIQEVHLDGSNILDINNEKLPVTREEQFIILTQKELEENFFLLNNANSCTQVSQYDMVAGRIKEYVIIVYE